METIGYFGGEVKVLNCPVSKNGTFGVYRVVVFSECFTTILWKLS